MAFCQQFYVIEETFRDNMKFMNDLFLEFLEIFFGRDFSGSTHLFFLLTPIFFVLSLKCHKMRTQSRFLVISAMSQRECNGKTLAPSAYFLNAPGYLSR